MTDEQIPDQCQYSSYAYWSWKTLSGLLSSSSCSTDLTSSPSWNYDIIHLQHTTFVIIYEDYQSLYVKTDLIKNIAGIAIANITRDSNELRLTNFILGIQPTNTQGGPNAVEMSDLLKDTKNQTCSDINRQDYSDINHQVCSDTRNRIYSDTNHRTFN
ncbi:20361_t:CDS:2 [Gigaspora margarita]|uniref:20361_t:CDS:1 n=1 Tax=Gigaspora margarita TaxID=4874 RepID=A0ABN7V8I1_GIGMA|nr:20361_t:CDS:2 [Gigaspora margarita]